MMQLVGPVRQCKYTRYGAVLCNSRTTRLCMVESILILPCSGRSHQVGFTTVGTYYRQCAMQESLWRDIRLLQFRNLSLVDGRSPLEGYIVCL
jgi:hypothetical protein